MIDTPPILLTVGDPTTEFVQCWNKATPRAWAIYNADDILTGAIVASGQTTPVFAPTITFYTGLNDAQTGYDQGQVQAAFSAANMALLVPGIRYTLNIYRALASSPSNLELIAVRRVVVLAVAIP